MSSTCKQGWRDWARPRHLLMPPSKCRPLLTPSDPFRIMQCAAFHDGGWPNMSPPQSMSVPIHWNSNTLFSFLWFLLVSHKKNHEIRGIKKFLHDIEQICRKHDKTNQHTKLAQSWPPLCDRWSMSAWRYNRRQTCLNVDSVNQCPSLFNFQQHVKAFLPPWICMWL